MLGRWTVSFNLFSTFSLYDPLLVFKKHFLHPFSHPSFTCTCVKVRRKFKIVDHGILYVSSCRLLQLQPCLAFFISCFCFNNLKLLGNTWMACHFSFHWCYNLLGCPVMNWHFAVLVGPQSDAPSTYMMWCGMPKVPNSAHDLPQNELTLHHFLWAGRYQFLGQIRTDFFLHLVCIWTTHDSFSVNYQFGHK